MKKFSIYEDNDEDIGFAVECLFAQCLNLDELKVWVDQVISILDVDDIPSYMFEIGQYEGSLAGIFEVIGFDPEWPFDEAQKSALYGIAYLRGMVKIEDFGLSEDEALGALQQFPQVIDHFRSLFPFIDL